MKNNFVLVETTMLKSIWNAYHYKGNKAPNWCYNFADIVRQFDEERWKPNLDGNEPKSNIIAFLKTSVLTKADKERLVDMRESTIDDGDCASIKSDDQNPFA